MPRRRCGISHTTATDHGDGVTASYVAGVDRGSESGHDATPQQSDDGRICGRLDLGALTLVDEGLVGESASANAALPLTRRVVPTSPCRLSPAITTSPSCHLPP